MKKLRKLYWAVGALQCNDFDSFFLLAELWPYLNMWRRIKNKEHLGIFYE